MKQGSIVCSSQQTPQRAYLNDLLASAYIPDLYSKDEQDGLANAVASKAKAAGVPQDNQSCFKYFISQVRANLHVCLCCSPVGPDFSTRCQRFPALVNCTVIDWFQPWPEQALYSVGCKFLEAIEDLGGDAVRAQLQTFMPELAGSTNAMATTFKQMEGRFVYTTPKSFLELLKLYSEIDSEFQLYQVMLNSKYLLEHNREMCLG